MKFSGPTPEQPTGDFWRMVDLARQDGDAFDAAAADLSPDELVDLYWTYDGATASLREPDYVERASLDLSEDGIDDLVTWAVAQGESYYRALLAEPSKLRAEAGEYNDVQGALVEEYERRYEVDLPFREVFEDAT